MDKNLQEIIKSSGFQGEMDDSALTIENYSHDASLFEIRPKIVVFPKNASDVEKLVRTVKDHKHQDKSLSLTARSAGTDMAGGAVNDSIIVDFRRHFTKIEEITSSIGHAQPGVLYKDFEVETLKNGALMPTFPASRDLASIGGMVANNSGGEKSLEYGKTKDFIEELKLVFADGIERVVKPINKAQLDKIMAQEDFEGEVYRKIYELCEKHYDLIKSAKPKVSKNSMGYTLWEVWDRETGIFDLTKLIVGSEGTLGFVTDITFRLVPNVPYSGLLVLFLSDIDDLGELIPTILSHKPATVESFDDQTLWLSIRFMPSFLKLLGPARFIHLLLSLIPDGVQLLKGVPKLIVMVEFRAQTESEVRQKIKALHKELKDKRARYEINGFEEDATEGKSEKFWVMRRQSFNLLRSKVKDKHTAPFIDDLVVNPEYLVDFLPKMRKIINKYKLFATIAGHLGDGNFHIIPLMKLENKAERDTMLPAMKEVNDLVLSYHGSLSGEHNDGLIRGPWLGKQFGSEMLKLFKDVKHIFDPSNIFNPHKKTDSNWDYSYSHIREHF